MNWKDLLKIEKQQPYFQNILAFITSEQSAGKTIYPKNNELFMAFKLTPLEQVKVIILGQDPYHGPGQAHGLSFSVPEGIAQPPSLRNIFVELLEDKQITHKPKSGCLATWAKQGVLLLNSTLSVEANKPQSHAHIGWQSFTDIVIQEISKNKNHLVFMLWGNNAKQKSKLIDANKHCILESVHPSPLSAHRGFIGCKHFSKTNDYLIKHKKKPINWQID